jgi:hypothetical protein
MFQYAAIQPEKWFKSLPQTMVIVLTTLYKQAHFSTSILDDHCVGNSMQAYKL